MEAASGQHYFPKWTEIAVTLAIIGFGFFVFAVCVKYLPIFHQEAAYVPISEPQTIPAEIPELENVES